MFMCLVNLKSVNKLDLTWKQSFLILSTKAFSAKTFSTKTFSTQTFSIMTLSITKLSIRY